MQDCLRPTWVCKTILSGSNLREPSQEPDFYFKFTIKQTGNYSLYDMLCFTMYIWEKTDFML